MKQNIAADLFGQTERIPATGGCSFPTRDELKVPLEGNSSVARCFCQGCCTLFEINEDGARGLEKEAGRSISSDEFFVVGGCELCDSEDKSVVIKKIE